LLLDQARAFELAQAVLDVRQVIPVEQPGDRGAALGPVLHADHMQDHVLGMLKL
jgi:hypothetical protein